MTVHNFYVENVIDLSNNFVKWSFGIKKLLILAPKFAY
jgi:hypothetical protein